MTVRTQTHHPSTGAIIPSAGLEANFVELYDLQNGDIDSTNMNMAANFTWSGDHVFTKNITLNRADTSTDGYFVFQTASTDKWKFGMVGDSTDDLNIYGATAAGKVATFVDGADTIFYFRDAQVSQAFTDSAPEDAFGKLSKVSTTQGGLVVAGYRANDGVALLLKGTTSSTAPTSAAVSFRASKSDGSTGDTNLADSEVAFVFEKDDGTDLISITGGGDFWLRNSAVSHSMTDDVPSDVYAKLGAQSETSGGLALTGYSDSDGSLVIKGVSNNTSPTDAPLRLRASKSDGGTGQTNIGNSEDFAKLEKNDGTDITTIRGNGEFLFTNIDPPTANFTNRNGNVKGWVLFDAAGTIQDSYNVSSVSRPSTGTYTVNWDTDFSSSSFSSVSTVKTGTSADYDCISTAGAATGASSTVRTYDVSSAALKSVAAQVIAIGDQ